VRALLAAGGLQCGDGDPASYRYSDAGRDRLWLEFRCEDGVGAFVCRGRFVNLSMERNAPFSAPATLGGGVLRFHDPENPAGEVVLGLQGQRGTCDVLGGKAACLRLLGRIEAKGQDPRPLYCVPSSGEWPVHR
jgi:hypothetical protein